MKIDLARYADKLLQLAPELPRLHVTDMANCSAVPFAKCSPLGFAYSPLIEDTTLCGQIDGYAGGPIIVLDLAAIAAAAEPGQFERSVRAVAVHELAHLLPHQPPIDELPATPEIQAAELRWMNRVVENIPSNPTEDPGHDVRFFRRCTHLFVRTALSGWDAALCLGVPGHWRSDAAYVGYLFSEAVQMRDASFAEIESREPPRLFLEQWCTDTTFYRNHKPKEVTV